MVKPDPILSSGTQSERARAADRYQERLVQQRQLVFNLLLAGLALAEVAFWYFDVELWIRIVVPIGWLGLVLHNNFLLVLHELWEINDQLSGRKDQFKALLSRDIGTLDEQ